MSADQILVLERGQIVAQGRHAELLEDSEIYAEIYSSQLVGDENLEGKERANHREEQRVTETTEILLGKEKDRAE